VTLGVLRGELDRPLLDLRRCRHGQRKQQGSECTNAESEHFLLLELFVSR
jgi:hypothetical protein